ncbi:MAG: HAMP domain-containing sensor histidine kinase [Elusimicrobia bacterium]|nr:HAMP domain-containing sensor histidine kinase [Elusimicrobiota bacterium]
MNKENKIEEKINQSIDLRWLINLRWIAVVVVFIVITFTRYVLEIKLPLIPLYTGNIVLFSYNILFFIYNRKLEFQKGTVTQYFKKANYFAKLQILMDLVALAYLIHFSGGVENPFIFYFIFHMVIASILLSNKAAYFQATLAVVLLGVIIAGEYLRVLPHYHLEGFFPVLSVGSELYLNPRYLLGIFSTFISTLYITIYFATTIVNRLRAEETELAVVNKKLEEQDKLKSQYVLTVSHDLQSSLSAIQSCLKVVLSDLTGAISEKSREMIARSEQRSQHLLHFVKDLLDLSKMRVDKEIEKKPVSLSEIVIKVVEQLKLKAEEKGLTISVGNFAGNTLISANPDAMEQLLINLTLNAIKYTPWGGKVALRITHSTLNNSVQVSIEDTGIGIPQEDLSHIFEDFYRAKNAEQMEKDGTGLGLSIVKQIINSHSGDIWVESEVGKGSKFSFTLPKIGKVK